MCVWGVWFIYFLVPVLTLPEPVEHSSSNAFKVVCELRNPRLRLRGAVRALSEQAVLLNTVPQTLSKLLLN